MYISFEPIIGIGIGIELLEDELDKFLCIELFFVRIMIDLGGME